MEVNDYAQAMRQARQDHGMTLKDLADASGVHINSISGYETGRNTPTLKALVLLSDALHMSIDAYVGHKRKTLF